MLNQPHLLPPLLADQAVEVEAGVEVVEAPVVVEVVVVVEAEAPGVEAAPIPVTVTSTAPAGWTSLTCPCCFAAGAKPVPVT